MSFGIAATIIGAGASIYGANKASDAQVKGDNAAIAEQRRQFDLIMGMLQPQINTGTQALNTLNRLYGYDTSPVPQVGGQAATPNATPNTRPNTLYGMVTDGVARFLGRVPSREQPITPTAPAASAAPQPTGMDVFFASPDYQFRRNEGMRGIENSFAARGGAASGNALRALNEFNSNLASSEFGNFFNRTAAMAGIGQAATNQGVGAAQYTGGNISNLLSNQGNSRASGIMGQTNALTGGLGDLLSFYTNRNGGNSPTGFGGGGGNWGGGNWGGGAWGYPWILR